VDLMACLIADCHVSLLLIAPCLNNSGFPLMLNVFRLLNGARKADSSAC
jgi:hypothetical protein